MDAFPYQNNTLHAEKVSLKTLAKTYGTPLYVYSESAFLEHFHSLDKAFSGIEHLICYSVKTNSNLSVISLLAQEGAGADVVSGGELVRALKAGVPAEKIVFAGVGKSREEMALGIKKNILMFNAESIAELTHLNEVAASLKKITRVALRVNPDIKAKTHAKISTGHKESKFGIPFEAARDIIGKFAAFRHLRLWGLHCHIGSQLLDPSPYAAAVEKTATLVPLAEKAGHSLHTFNLGGGFGIRYRATDKPPAFSAFAKAIVPIVKPLGLRLLMEPGRSMAGNAGILLTQVLYTKQGGKHFVIVDAAMNDLMRPALYDAFHEVAPVVKSRAKTIVSEVVGPVCETGDVLAHARALPPVKEGDLLALMSAGAYGMAMASNYNTRPRPAEVMVSGGKHRLIRRRETLSDLMRQEQGLD